MVRASQFLFILLAVILVGKQASATNWHELHPLVAGAPQIGDQNLDALPLDGPVVVTFFASWCPPCTDEFEHLNGLASDGRFGNMTIVAINLFEDFGGKKNPARMARFLERTQPRFRLIEGSAAMRTAFGNIDRIPTVVVYGASGDEIWRFVHQRDAVKTHATRQDLERALALDDPDRK